MRRLRSPPPMEELIKEFQSATLDVQARLFPGAKPAPDGKYRHWDTLRHLEPPEGLTTKQWWFSIKVARQAQYKMIPLLDKGGDPFRFASPDVALEMLHSIDKDAAGQLSSSTVPAVSEATKDQYLIRSLVEEPISSSQLEGASTTTEAAKNMLRSGRDPQNKSERMIINNYRAMKHVSAIRNQALTPEMILNLHTIVVRDTLEDVQDEGRLRTAADDVAVKDNLTGTVLHVPPPAHELEERLDALCAFANNTEETGFIHPVVRSILLHLWLAYDHPFVDGNGRTSRALFYWSMLHQGYWLAEYLSISTIIKEAPVKYARSFLYTESDENDATYFLLSQMRIICRSIEGLLGYIERKSAELNATQKLLSPSRLDLNHRQLAILNDMSRNPQLTLTIAGHQKISQVVYQTARTDLLALASTGLVVKHRQGRTFIFFAAPDLADRLKDLAEDSS